jgi:uncharacterized membrane protein
MFITSINQIGIYFTRVCNSLSFTFVPFCSLDLSIFKKDIFLLEVCLMTEHINRLSCIWCLHLAIESLCEGQLQLF